MKQEQSDYLKSIKAGLDLGMLKQLPLNKEVLSDPRLSLELLNNKYKGGEGAVWNQGEKNAQSLVNLASYNFRQVRDLPHELNAELNPSPIKEKGKIIGGVNARPNIFGE